MMHCSNYYNHRLGGHKICWKGSRAVKVGVVRRTEDDTKLAQQSIVSRVHSREEIS